MFTLIAALIGTDVIADAFEGASMAHLVVEAVAVLLALFGVGYLVRLVMLTRRRLRLLSHRVSEARADAARWQAEAKAVLSGLGVAIDKQFAEWSLSDAEREVALLLLKGLPLRQIAELRGTSERTVRQQSLAVYRKAGVEGRAELSAFFLEDLLLPAK